MTFNSHFCNWHWEVNWDWLTCIEAKPQHCGSLGNQQNVSAPTWPYFYHCFIFAWSYFCLSVILKLKVHRDQVEDVPCIVIYSTNDLTSPKEHVDQRLIPVDKVSKHFVPVLKHWMSTKIDVITNHQYHCLHHPHCQQSNQSWRSSHFQVSTKIAASSTSIHLVDFDATSVILTSWNFWTCPD